MSSLRDLLPIAVPSANYKQIQLAIYHNSISSVQNGGCCCCWVVPIGTTWATFELWGAGGDGGGACCCSGLGCCGPGTGHYAKISLTVTAGCYFCTCAAGSGCCAQSHCGTCGFPSWVNCGSNGQQVICAGGGYTGCVGCWHGYWGCTGICNGAQNFGCNLCAPASGRQPDVGIASIGGTAKDSNYCFSSQWFAATGAPKYGMSTRTGLERCTNNNTRQGCDAMNGSKWPAGMGTPSSACGGGCCWGGWGAGGLVLITYG